MRSAPDDASRAPRCQLAPAPESRHRGALAGDPDEPRGEHESVPAVPGAIGFLRRRLRATWEVRDERGFTLIELLVVVIILGLLAALVGPRLLGRVGQSKTAAARVQIELLGAALDQFKLDVGRYPATQEGLQALQVSPGNAPGWAGPYLKKDVPRDPWGTPYQYKSPGDHGEYDLFTYGADQTPGGEGENTDITSWGTEGKSQ